MKTSPLLLLSLILMMLGSVVQETTVLRQRRSLDRELNLLTEQDKVLNMQEDLIKKLRQRCPAPAPPPPNAKL